MPLYHKLYLVVFTLASSNKRVYKIGYHRGSDISNRFARELQSGTITDFRIWLSVWVPADRLETAESECFSEIVDRFGGYRGKFHNFWSSEKIGGITEMREYDLTECRYARSMLLRKGYRYLPNQT